MIKNISAWKISSLNEYSVQIRLGSNLGGFFACAMSRELILKSMVEKLRDFYDFIIIGSMPYLGMMTIKACSVSHPLG